MSKAKRKTRFRSLLGQLRQLFFDRSFWATMIGVLAGFLLTGIWQNVHENIKRNRNAIVLLEGLEKDLSINRDKLKEIGDLKSVLISETNVSTMFAKSIGYMHYDLLCNRNLVSNLHITFFEMDLLSERIRNYQTMYHSPDSLNSNVYVDIKNGRKVSHGSYLETIGEAFRKAISGDSRHNLEHAANLVPQVQAELNLERDSLIRKYCGCAF